MIENILITGITGSGGSYLAEYIVKNKKNVKVHGICRWHSTSTMNNIGKIKDQICIYECDLLDLGSVIRTLNKIKPSKIFHLAAYANVQKCFDTPLSVINNNVMGTANLLEAIRMVCPSSVMQICSTSEVYGNPVETPIYETHPLQPVNPYASSKLAQESLAYAYHKTWNLKVIITRMFAYINPRRTFLFASDFAKQIIEIENGKKDKLYHGNLDSIRTLIDIRDATKSYWLAAQKCDVGEYYNIGGKNKISVGEFLDLLKSKAKTKIVCEQSSDLLRPVDITLQIPNIDKFVNQTNWGPKYSLNESIDFLLNYYRNNQ